MEFHVWDFSRRIEVRLRDEYIQKIRSMTVKKQIRVTTKPYLGHGWKKPRAANKVMEKDVKLIAFSQGHPYHKIAEKLYPKKDWHGVGRAQVEHRPFITIDDFLKVHEITGLPLDEMESNVIQARNNWMSRVEIPMRFPVVANEDWAFLLGLWHSCGGMINRHRVSKRYPTKELSVRFAVDTRVYEEKVKLILDRIGYPSHLCSVWYVKKGLTHPLDKNRRKGVGNQPRKYFVLVRTIREIMHKFGLPGNTAIPLRTLRVERIGRYGRYGIRRFYSVIPEWIKENKLFSRAFIEGFLNGVQIGSDFSQFQGYLRRDVELRFAGFNKEEVESFFEFFRKTLEEYDISGYHHIMRGKSSDAYWIGFLIHNNKCLKSLFENFDVRRPDLRARLALNYFMNALLYEACRELTSSEILVLGSLIEKPMTEEKIARDFRFRKENIDSALEKLERLRLARKFDGSWRVKPTSYRKKLLDRLWKLEERRRKMILAANDSFYARCNECGNLLNRNFRGACGCGGRYQPITRFEALRSIVGRGSLAKIHKVSSEEIPSHVGDKINRKEG